MGQGWSPIVYMVRLCAELFDAELIILKNSADYNVLQKLLALAPRRRGSNSCLLIAGGPLQLRSLLQIEGWRRRFVQVAGWIIDSCWTDLIPRIVRYGNIFDRFFITTYEDLETWHKATGRPISVIPWGADVLRLGSPNPTRPVDLLRVGRQPAQWDDDVSTLIRARAKGLCFRGRPESRINEIENHRMLMSQYAESKFLLAFSNTAHRDAYTHPTRAYITGRWTDGLAAGATIAGVAPKSTTADGLLWPGATLDLNGIDRDRGLDVITSAVASWTPDRALKNYWMAAERLDWRWRFLDIANALKERAPRLSAEVGQLKQQIGMHKHQGNG